MLCEIESRFDDVRADYDHALAHGLEALALADVAEHARSLADAIELLGRVA